jgi:hypothetical protein
MIVAVELNPRPNNGMRLTGASCSQLYVIDKGEGAGD